MLKKSWSVSNYRLSVAGMCTSLHVAVFVKKTRYLNSKAFAYQSNVIAKIVSKQIVIVHTSGQHIPLILSKYTNNILYSKHVALFIGA